MARCKAIDEAAREWVNGFNAFPIGMISKLMEVDMDAWREVTTPQIGDSVYVYELPEDCDSIEHAGEITGYDEDEDTYKIRLNDDTVITVVAVDDCTLAVMSVPVSIPVKRLVVMAPSTWRNCGPAIFCRASLIDFIPNISNANEPMSLKIIHIDMKT